MLLWSAIFEMPRQVNCESACGRWLGHLLAGLGLLAAQQAYPHRLCRSYADYRCFSLPPLVSTLLFVLFDLFFTSLPTCPPPPPTGLLPSFLFTPSSSSFAPPAQCAFRWFRLHWDAEQLSEPVQLQPVTGSKGQDPVFRRQ